MDAVGPTLGELAGGEVRAGAEFAAGVGAGRGPRERVRVEGVGVVVARLAERDDGADIVVVARANHPVEVGRAFGGSETAGRRGGATPSAPRPCARP